MQQGTAEKTEGREGNMRERWQKRRELRHEEKAGESER